jgi:hypothetical protein
MFLPLRDLARQNPERRELLLKHQLAPAFHVGPVAGVGDAHVMLSEMFDLPSAFFGLSLIEFSEHAAGEAGQRHLVAARHGNRCGRLDSDEMVLLRRKMAALWPRFDETEILER